MASVGLMLIFDDIELGLGLARIAKLSFCVGDLALARQFQSDAEDCYVRAERFCVDMSPGEQKAAESGLRLLGTAIGESSDAWDRTDFDTEQRLWFSSGEIS